MVQKADMPIGVLKVFPLIQTIMRFDCEMSSGIMYFTLFFTSIKSVFIVQNYELQEVFSD